MNQKAIITISVTVVVCGVLFWPTLYRYDLVVVGGNTFPVRMNRVTGYTAHYLAGKWVSEEGQESVPTKEDELLPPEEQAKVTGGNAGFDRYGASFIGEIYNGSSRWTITSLILRVAAYQAPTVSSNQPAIPKQLKLSDLLDGAVEIGVLKWDRRFKTRAVIFPLSTGKIHVSVESGKEDVPEWSIEEIRGYPEKNK